MTTSQLVAAMLAAPFIAVLAMTAGGVIHVRARLLLIRAHTAILRAIWCYWIVKAAHSVQLRLVGFHSWRTLWIVSGNDANALSFMAFLAQRMKHYQ